MKVARASKDGQESEAAGKGVAGGVSGRPRAESIEALTADALDQCRALVQQYVSKGHGPSMEACDSAIVCRLVPRGVKSEEPFMCGSIERLGPSR